MTTPVHILSTQRLSAHHHKPQSTTTAAGCPGGSWPQYRRGAWGVTSNAALLVDFLRPHGPLTEREAPTLSHPGLLLTRQSHPVQGVPGPKSAQSRGGFPTGRSCRASPCMMQPSWASLARACLRDSCPPGLRCSRRLLRETMVLSWGVVNASRSRCCRGFGRRVTC